MAFQFGTSGVRGLVNDFQPKVTSLLVEAFIGHAKTKFNFQKVAIARDLRESSLGIAYFCKQSIENGSIETLDLKDVSTPNLAFFCQNHKIPGIMITGSHIPSDRNGIKFYFPNGEILKEDEVSIWSRFEILSSKIMKEATKKEIAETDFLARYENFFAPYKNLFCGQRVIVYQHSSPLRDAMVKLLSKLEFDAIPVGRSSIFVPVDTEAVGEIERIADWIKTNNKGEKKVFAVVSTDGDGDRPFVCDEKGVQVRGDVLGLITSRFLKIKTIVTPVSSTTAIEESGSFNVLRTKIGSPFVIEGLQNAVASPVAGFEANGGFILASDIRGKEGTQLDSLLTRDSVLPILSTLTSALVNGFTVSDLVNSLPPRITSSDVFRGFKPELAAKLTTIFTENTSQFTSWFGEIESIDFTDGSRIYLKTGDIVHFRPSGNAPEFRIYSESKDLAQAEHLSARGKAFLESL